MNWQPAVAQRWSVACADGAPGPDWSSQDLVDSTLASGFSRRSDAEVQAADPGRVRSAYEFIKAHRDQYSVQMMCRVLEVAPSGYYDWLHAARSRIARRRTPDCFA